MKAEGVDLDARLGGANTISTRAPATAASTRAYVLFPAPGIPTITDTVATLTARSAARR